MIDKKLWIFISSKILSQSNFFCISLYFVAINPSTDSNLFLIRLWVPSQQRRTRRLSSQFPLTSSRSSPKRQRSRQRRPNKLCVCNKAKFVPSPACLPLPLKPMLQYTSVSKSAPKVRVHATKVLSFLLKWILCMMPSFFKHDNQI